MAICTTGAEWASESAYFSGPHVQIVQAIFRWAVRDFAQAPPIAMGRATAAEFIPRVKQKRDSSAQSDTGRPVSKGVRRTMLKIRTG